MLNSIFPIINNIDDLRPHVEHLPEIRFAQQENGLLVVCAMIADNNTYSGEHAAWARECRGITFYPDGTIAVRPLHKFFNVGERADTQAGDLPWHEVVRNMEKRDGSVINPVLIDGSIVFKSKKSFTSDVAAIANKAASLSDRLFSHWCLDHGYSPTFELTSPAARIVIKYHKTELTLLHIRETVSGRYLSRSEIIGLIIQSMIDDIKLVDEFPPMTWGEIKSKLETLEGVEGYCLQFANGEIVKAKTKWYLDRHHALTALTQRNVAEMVISETLDDLKSYISELNEPELVEKVEAIERDIVSKINLLAELVEKEYEMDKNLSRKDFAIKHQKSRHFGLLMERYLGKEPDYKGYYAKHHLKNDWDVSTI